MSFDPGAWTQRALLVTALLLAAVGCGLVAWLGGTILPQGRYLAAALVWLAWVGISWVAVMSTRKLALKRLNRKLDLFRDGHGDRNIIALVEQLAAERSQAIRELEALHEDLEHLQDGVRETLEGTGDPVWPVSGRAGHLASALQALLGDRRDDAAAASELLALWIEHAEGLQIQVQESLDRLDAYRVRVQESSWGKSFSKSELERCLRELQNLLNTPTENHLVGERGVGGGSNKPLASSLSRLSKSLSHLEQEMARAESGERETRAAGEALSRAQAGLLEDLRDLERGARRLRRRLGGDAAAELKKEDFVG